jgi:hypothetical protein
MRMPVPPSPSPPEIPLPPSQARTNDIIRLRVGGQLEGGFASCSCFHNDTIQPEYYQRNPLAGIAKLEGSRSVWLLETWTVTPQAMGNRDVRTYIMMLL